MFYRGGRDNSGRIEQEGDVGSGILAKKSNLCVDMEIRTCRYYYQKMWQSCRRFEEGGGVKSHLE